MKKISLLFVLPIAFLASSHNAFASVQTPEFNSCLTPNGSVVADYTDGTHGIIGAGSKDGHDTVYSLENGNALQCLCATDGSGTQTNWLKISDLSEDQIKIYENQGWIYIPDGSAWGLSEGEYLAQNLAYSCGGGTSTTQSSQGDGKTDGRTDGRSDGRGSSIVQSAVGNAGLASTGNIIFLLSVLGAGVFMTLFGVWLRRNSN
jgi:hypothetical protein